MKYIRITLLAAIAALQLTGCDMSEDYRNCPTPENVTLRFSLTDKQGAEVFTDRIEKTDLLLFRNGRYHSHQSIQTASLGTDRSIALTLDPGTYTVVSWGNLGTRVALCGIDENLTPEMGTVMCHSTENGDQAYYAASPELGLTRGFNPQKRLFAFDVPESGTTNETIKFTHAHNALDVYVKGYSVGGKLPIVQVCGNRQGYDFYMNYAGTETISFEQQSVNKTTDGRQMANAVFYTSRIRPDNTITINILHPITKAVEYSVALSDVIDSFTDFDVEVEIVIPILFEFFDERFEVKIPSWDTEPSMPGLN